jgi:hypothetical protein
MTDELTAGAVQTRVRQLADAAWDALSDENKDRQIVLEQLLQSLQRLAGPAPTHATVQLFKPGGKWYTDESWRIPPGAIGPWDMEDSPDFHRISGGPVLVETQEPWGYPFLLAAESRGKLTALQDAVASAQAEFFARVKNLPNRKEAAVGILINALDRALRESEQ